MEPESTNSWDNEVQYNVMFNFKQKKEKYNYFKKNCQTHEVQKPHKSFYCER